MDNFLKIAGRGSFLDQVVRHFFSEKSLKFFFASCFVGFALVTNSAIIEKKQCDTECNNPLYYSTEYLQQHNEITLINDDRLYCC